jgi:hypothetical protein
LGNVEIRTIFLIETLNGRSVRNHSQFTDEEEILLFPGTCFQVKFSIKSITSSTYYSSSSKEITISFNSTTF